jgi:hypothetical protein
MATIINTNADLSLVQLLFGGLILIGILIKWITGLLPPTASIGEATGTIWGYSIVLFSLIGLVIIQLDSNNNPTKQLSEVPYSLYILSVIVLWIIVLNVKYSKSINTKTIPPTYYLWNTWSTIFIILITGIIILQYYSTISKVNSYINSTLLTKENKSKLDVYLGFILFLNVLITGIQTTILKNFRVDG